MPKKRLPLPLKIHFPLFGGGQIIVESPRGITTEKAKKIIVKVAAIFTKSKV